jgi:hypothetical protein
MERKKKFVAEFLCTAKAQEVEVGVLWILLSLVRRLVHAAGGRWSDGGMRATA